MPMIAKLPRVRGTWAIPIAVGLSLLAAVPRARAEAAEAGPNVMDALVRIDVSAAVPDPAAPWQKKVESVSGSGVILGNGKILTNAHVVANRVHVEVRRAGHARRWPARVLYAGHESDLALLTVDDPSFFEGTAAFPMGRMPRVRDRVDVYGFPVGGESASVTSGIVSRVEVQPLVHSGVEILQAQIDAALNPGNSGGPVVASGGLVGIAAQELEDAQSVGYIIPVPVIRQFLDDLDDGRYDGFPDLGVELQPVENEAHRRFLGLREDESGGLVTGVHHGGSADGALEPGDVLLSIAGKPLAEDLSVALEGMGPVLFTHLVRSHQVGDTVSVSFLRQGERRQAQVKLGTLERLVPGPRYDREPTYLILGGLVFVPLDHDYLDACGDEMPSNLVEIEEFQNIVTAERREVPVLSRVLAHDVNQGYDAYANLVVRTVNGAVPRDMKHLASILDGAAGKTVEFVFDDRSRLVLDVNAARASSPEILREYGIPADRSRDLGRNGTRATR
jgi:S1-C subfamily serine protease